jgi:hypothetical protein
VHPDKDPVCLDEPQGGSTAQRQFPFCHHIRRPRRPENRTGKANLVRPVPPRMIAPEREVGVDGQSHRVFLSKALIRNDETKPE